MFPLFAPSSYVGYSSLTPKLAGCSSCQNPINRESYSTSTYDIYLSRFARNGHHRAGTTALASSATPCHRLTICDRLCRRSRCA